MLNIFIFLGANCQTPVCTGSNFNFPIVSKFYSSGYEVELTWSLILPINSVTVFADRRVDEVSSLMNKTDGLTSTECNVKVRFLQLIIIIYLF